MLDLNHRLKPGNVSAQINLALDRAVVAASDAKQRREYLGASRLGDPCARRLQFEFTNTPPDRPRFDPRILRIFERGHALEALAIRELQAAGFDLATRTRHGEQIGFAVLGGKMAGHVDGIIFGAPVAMRLPCIWEHKGLRNKGWQRVVREGVAVAQPHYHAQISLYQAYFEEKVPGVSDNPALFTATNADTMERYHELVPFDAKLAQESSDKGVRVIQACEAGELLPRVATNSDHHECRFCAWSETCWRLS